MTHDPSSVSEVQDPPKEGDNSYLSSRWKLPEAMQVGLIITIIIVIVMIIMMMIMMNDDDGDNGNDYDDDE